MCFSKPQGFICPICMEGLKSADALQVHWEAAHVSSTGGGEGGGGGGGGGGRGGGGREEGKQQGRSPVKAMEL